MMVSSLNSERAPWSQQEVSAIVADYLEMLELELRGAPFSKTERRRALQGLLRNRSEPSVEFKHANISAVLTELGYPCIDGYKPRGNYQELLKTEVEVQIAGRAALTELVAAIAMEAAPSLEPRWTVEDVIVPAPVRERSREVHERPSVASPPQQVNYLEREARNASLGLAGELFVLELEHRRLWELGERDLARRIEHISAVHGDGLGFDILSFDEKGRERLIEVKTTAFGSMTPFFASAKEIAVSESEPAFHLYRVFRFRDRPQVFVLPGSLRESCELQPTQFRARVAS